MPHLSRISSFKSTLLLAIIFGFLGLLNSQEPLDFFVGETVVFLALLLTMQYLTLGKLDLAAIAFFPVAISWSIHQPELQNISTIPVIQTIYLGILADLSAIYTKYHLSHFRFNSLFSSLLVKFRFILLPLISIILFIFITYLQFNFSLSFAGKFISSTGLFLMLSISTTPMMLYFLVHRRTSRGQYPITFFLMLRTIYAYGLFIFGCLILTILGVILFVIIPLKAGIRHRKVLFHLTIMWFCRILIFATAKRLEKISWQNVNFNLPSVIIANHQSFIDLILVLSLHPKLVLLTNDWVWSSPFFGKVVQWADFYPVSSGIEDSIEKLRKIKDGGYSIVVFPEGSRSLNSEIKRFRKGAFYLAEQLELDLQPLILHGTGESIAKGEFIFKNACLTIKALSRYPFNNSDLGKDYSAKAKAFTMLFRKEYTLLRRKCETQEILKNRLWQFYGYRNLKTKLAIHFSLRRNKELINYLFNHIPEGNILHIESGYGEITRLLSYRYPNSVIKGIEAGSSNNVCILADNDNALKIENSPTEFQICLINVDRFNQAGFDREFFINEFGRYFKFIKQVLLYSPALKTFHNSNITRIEDNKRLLGLLNSLGFTDKRLIKSQPHLPAYILEKGV